MDGGLHTSMLQFIGSAPDRLCQTPCVQLNATMQQGHCGLLSLILAKQD